MPCQLHEGDLHIGLQMVQFCVDAFPGAISGLFSSLTEFGSSKHRPNAYHKQTRDIHRARPIAYFRSKN